MESPEYAGDAGASTLVLIQDAEFELHASRSSIAFPTWGSVEAKGKKRIVCFSISLLAHAREDTVTAQTASVPLVITAPLTSRFVLLSKGASLIPLLRTGSPLQFEVLFVPPCDQTDSDLGCANFQDQIVIQTRLAKLCIRLHALRDVGTRDLCPPESFSPLILPTVKAPSFKLFDQIERDAATTTTSSQRPSSSSHRVSISGSFHPQRNDGHRLDSLSPLPPRQPTPPQQCAVQSRPSSSSSRRTPSPRVLEPLVAPHARSVTAAVDNQAEAREIILRLRARRSSQSCVPVSKAGVDNPEPTSPESQLDAKAKAELDQFNALVKAAKADVAGEVSKAKQELEFYKSLLPQRPPTESFPEEVLPPRATWNTPETTHKGLSKKPAKLQALAAETEGSTVVAASRHQDNNQSSRTAPGVPSTNQEVSPVKRARSKQAPKVPVQPPQATEAQSKEAQPLRGGGKTKPVDAVKPKGAIPVVTSKPSTIKSSNTPVITKAPTLKAAVAPTKLVKPASKTLKKITQVSNYEHALDDFDDADPEIDDAPVFPDDLAASRRLREEEDEDDPMLTMKAPLY